MVQSFDDEYDDDIQNEYSLVPIPCYSSSDTHVILHVPYSSSTVVVGSKIYLISVPEDDNSSPSTCVRILDCKIRTWRNGPNMNVARAGAVYLDEKIYVIGGCEKGESWMEVFDVKTLTWRILANHGVVEELQCERWFMINVRGGKIYAIADKKEYVYNDHDKEEGTWKVLETHIRSEGSIDPWCVIENVMYCYTKSGKETLVREDQARKEPLGEIWGKLEWTNTMLNISDSYKSLADLYKFFSCAFVSM